MKILVAGNLANTGYFLASKLREENIDIDLLMEDNPHPVSDPKNTGELEFNEYPKWIKFWNKNCNWKYQIIKKIREYDITCAATELPIFAFFALKPYIALATGSDLRELAKSKTIKGILLRMAYKKAKVIIFTDPDLIYSIKELNLKNSLYCPPIRDFYKMNSSEKVLVNKNKFNIFYPTTHIWSVKGNEVFIKAFIQVAKKRNNIHLTLINKGKDFKKSLKLLEDAQIREKYTVLPKPLNQNELVSYYQNCNVIVDQFILGSLGSIGLEAMFMSKPVIAYVDNTIYSKIYGENPPVLNCKTIEEIYLILIKLLDNKNDQNIGKNANEWILKYHSPEMVSQKYYEIFKKVYEKNKINFLSVGENYKVNSNIT
jgi:glycosyltransferase involved in cell wall biosynthesis